MSYLTSVKSNTVVNNTVLLLVRFFIGFAMLTHGYPKLQLLLSGDEIQFVDFLGVGAKTSLILAVFAEFVCSLFLILGLFTRWAAFFLIVTMATAGFMVHGADPFAKQEMSFLYLAVYLLIIAFGPGGFSIDGMITKRKESAGW